MTNEHPLEEYEFAPQPDRRFGWIAAALALLVALAAGGWGLFAQRQAGIAERALAAAHSERESAAAAAETLLQQADAARQAADARVAELEQRAQSLDQLLQAANVEVSRLESEFATRIAHDVSSEEPMTSATIAAGDTTVAVGGLGTEEPPVAATVEPAAAPPMAEAAAEALAITFDVNSSYLPAGLDGRLRQLAARLEPGRGYEVELVGSVGNGDVAGKSAEDALRYNRWIAERRMGRVVEFLQRNAKADALTVRQDFALNDPSRKVMVEVRPLLD